MITVVRSNNIFWNLSQVFATPVDIDKISDPQSMQTCPEYAPFHIEGRILDSLEVSRHANTSLTQLVLGFVDDDGEDPIYLTAVESPELIEAVDDADKPEYKPATWANYLTSCIGMRALNIEEINLFKGFTLTIGEPGKADSIIFNTRMPERTYFTGEASA